MKRAFLNPLLSMSFLFLLPLSSGLLSCAHKAAEAVVSSTGFTIPVPHKKAEFEAHADSQPMKSYLAMNLPYEPYKTLLEQLDKKENITLKNRGEAHITVITPVEFDKVLKKHVTMEEINALAEAAKIQEIPYTPICIGKAQKELSGKMEATYFVVVESPGLMDLRGQIEDLYIKKGGKPQQFVPERFSPHVTLGFTARDLHAEDGIHKNRNSCVHQLTKAPN